MRLIEVILSNYYVRKLAEGTLFNPLWINSSFYTLIYSRIIKSRVLSLSNEIKPRSLIVENTNMCNAACTMCPNELMTRKRDHMKQDLFVKIVNNSRKAGISSIVLCGYGEPLLDPLLFERLDICRSSNISASLYTNASLLDEETSCKLIDHKLKHVNISFDSIDQKEYENIRKKLSFEEVLKNINNFIKIRNETGSDLTIRIAAKDSGMQNEADKLKFHRFWQGKIDKNRDRIDVGFTDERRSSERYGFDINRHEIFSRFPCVYLWTNFTVLVNGDVVLCCFDYDGISVVGSLLQQDISEIWIGEKMESLRRNHLCNQYDNISICKNCSYFPNWWLPY